MNAIRRLSIITVFAILFAIPLTAVSAMAQTDAPSSSSDLSWVEKRQPKVEIFISSLFAAGVTEGSLGLRGSLRLSQRFDFEASVSRLATNNIELYMGDVSAKFYARRRGKASLFLIGGVGAFTAVGETATLGHFGIGTDVSLTRRLYLRPELRARFRFEDFDANFGDLTIAFGWKF